MTQILVDLDSIEDIENKLKSLIQMGQKIQSRDFKKLIRQKTWVLNEKEKIVFEYIRKNPGQSKQNIVNSLVKEISRNTVFKVIRNLVRYQMVIQRSDDSNIQKHQLYINRESLITQVEEEIKNFKKSYLKLIKRANEEYQRKEDLTRDELMNSRRPHIDIPEIYSSGVVAGLSRILKQLIISYSLKAIFEWPEKIKDSDSLNRLYLMVFQSMNEIFSELVKHVPFDIKEEHKRIEYLQEGLSHSYEDAKSYADMITEFHEYGLDTEFDLVMSDLFTASKMPIKWKDYRAG